MLVPNPTFKGQRHPPRCERHPFHSEPCPICRRVKIKPTIFITTFVRRQTETSPFSHWTISDDELLNRIHSHWPLKKQGYREGVILVPVNPDGFYSSTIQLEDGDLLIGEFSRRQPTEEPRKHTYVLSTKQKIPARSVWIVLYNRNVLAEKSENESNCDWEIVSVNASASQDDQPMQSGTLIANHLQLSGGTATNMTDAEFVAALRISIEFWKDKALLCPEHLRTKSGE